MKGGPQRSLWVVTAEKVTQIATVALVNIVILRVLGPDVSGFYTAATAVLTILLPLTLFGQTVVSQLIAAQPAAAVRLTRIAVVLSTIGALVAGAAMAACAAIAVFGTETDALLAVLALAALARPLSAVEVFFQAFHLDHVVAPIRLAVVVAGAGGRFLVAVTTQSLLGLAIVVVVENLVMGVILFVVYRLRFRPRYSSAHAPQVSLRAVVATSAPLLVSGLLTLAYMRAPQPILLTTAGSDEVAYFSAAVNLTDAAGFLPTVLLGVLLPVFARLRHRDDDAAARRAQKALAAVAGVGYALGAVGVVSSFVVIPLLYGAEYDESIVVLQVLCAALPMIFVGLLRSIVTIPRGWVVETLVSSGVAAVVCVGMTVALAPVLGAVGGAVAVLCAHILNGLVVFALFRRTRPLFRQCCVALLPWRALPAVITVVRRRSLE